MLDPHALVRVLGGGGGGVQAVAAGARPGLAGVVVRVVVLVAVAVAVAVVVVAMIVAWRVPGAVGDRGLGLQDRDEDVRAEAVIDGAGVRLELRRALPLVARVVAVLRPQNVHLRWLQSLEKKNRPPKNGGPVGQPRQVSAVHPYSLCNPCALSIPPGVRTRAAARALDHLRADQMIGVSMRPWRRLPCATKLDRTENRMRHVRTGHWKGCQTGFTCRRNWVSARGAGDTRERDPRKRDPRERSGLRDP